MDYEVKEEGKKGCQLMNSDFLSLQIGVRL